jgi:hypothetical protein
VGQGAGKQALITFFFLACQKDQRGQAIVLLFPLSVLPAPCSLPLAFLFMTLFCSYHLSQFVNNLPASFLLFNWNIYLLK